MIYATVAKNSSKNNGESDENSKNSGGSSGENNEKSQSDGNGQDKKKEKFMPILKTEFSLKDCSRHCSYFFSW